MRIYFSGGTTGQTVPERLIEDRRISVMPSYSYTVKKGIPNERLKKLMRSKRVHSFLDSGAHSLYNDNVVDTDWLRKTAYLDRRDIPTNILERVVATSDCVPFENRESWEERYAYYDSDDCNTYIETYCNFLKKYGKGLDYYVTVDAIFNPEKSWELQKRLEDDHGVTPVPVIHWGADLKWIKRYLKAGYKYLGIGGLGQIVSRAQYEEWADGLFQYLCDKDGVPRAETHGFAMTSLRYLVRYPWTSVDSASWQKLAGYGRVIVPTKRDGKFALDLRDKTRMPMLIGMSDKSNSGFHYHSLTKEKQKVLMEWLEYIGIPFGDSKYVQQDSVPLSGQKKRGYLRHRIRGIRMGRKNVTMEEELEARGGKTKIVKNLDGLIEEREGYGVSTEHHARCKANLRFFLEVQDHLTENPVRFGRKRKSFGLSL